MIYILMEMSKVLMMYLNLLILKHATEHLLHAAETEGDIQKEAYS